MRSPLAGWLYGTVAGLSVLAPAIAPFPAAAEDLSAAGRRGAGAAPAEARLWAEVQESPDGAFRLEWSKAGQKLDGYVYNLTSRHAARMRLRIEGIDASGNIVTTQRTWVTDVPPNNRAYFQVTVGDAPAYRVTV
jgi:hypothetical protein